MRQITVFFTILILVLTIAPAVSAQSRPATRSATPATRSADPIRGNIATKAADVKSRNKHVIGTITAISGVTLQVTSLAGTALTVTTNNTTKFVDLAGSRRLIALRDLRVGNKIAVLGFGKDDTTGVARVIVRLPAASPTVREAVFGSIAAVADNKVTLKLRTGTSSAVLITPTTKLTIRGVNNPTTADLKVNQKAVATGVRNADGALVATKFMALPTVGISNTRPATSSARPSTRSATPTTATPSGARNPTRP